MDDDSLARYLSKCSRFEFGAPWDFLAADNFSFRAPTDPAATFERLSTEFPAEALINCGLAARDGTTAPSPHPSLTLPEAPLIALQAINLHRAANLLFAEGSLLRPRAARLQQPAYLADSRSAQTQ